MQVEAGCKCRKIVYLKKGKQIQCGRQKPGKTSKVQVINKLLIKDKDRDGYQKTRTGSITRNKNTKIKAQ